MKEKRNAFRRFCMAMGDDNENCCVCPLQKICDGEPYKRNFEDESEYVRAYEKWDAAANRLAEKAARTFNIAI